MGIQRKRWLLINRAAYDKADRGLAEDIMTRLRVLGIPFDHIDDLGGFDGTLNLGMVEVTPVLVILNDRWYADSVKIFAFLDLFTPGPGNDGSTKAFPAAAAVA